MTDAKVDAVFNALRALARTLPRTPEHFTFAAAAKELGTSVERLESLARIGAFIASRIGGRRYICRAEMEHLREWFGRSVAPRGLECAG